MKPLLPFLLAVLLLCFSCETPVPQRGDTLSIDNPSGVDYFIVIDEDTLALPAYTFIKDFKPVCTGEENITYESGHNPGIHRYRVLDANKKQLFDTSFQSHYRHLLINPTRSTYVEWTLFYGDAFGRNDSVYIDSVLYEGTFRFYSSFAIENECMHGLECDRTIAASMKVLRFEETEEFIPPAGTQVEFMRQQDFIVAYHGFPGPTIRQHAETELTNILNEFYTNTVNHRSNPFQPGELAPLSQFIANEQYAEAVDFVHYHSDYFQKRDSAAFRRMNEQMAIYAGEPEENVLLPFTPLFIWTYDLDFYGNVYRSKEEAYDSATGDCKTTELDPPVADL
jgi:hypothetical protein